MAFMNCPKCARVISDRAAACPHCRCQLAPAFPVDVTGIMEDSPYFFGSVFDFGIWNCLKTEANNFLMRRLGKSVYTSKAHSVQPIRRIDKTKGQITRIWALGLLGVLGLHYFPIGRFVTGTIRLLYGALMLEIGIAVSLSYRAAQEIDPLRIMLVFLAAVFIPSVIELVMILSGKFSDVFRSHVQ